MNVKLEANMGRLKPASKAEVRPTFGIDLRETEATRLVSHSGVEGAACES